nr:hypothetical protein [Candidatus Njordarchaeota archaeon]
MIREHASLQGGDIVIRYESQDIEDLNKMKRSIKRIVDEGIVDEKSLTVQDHHEYFEVRINKRYKKTAKKLIELVGYGEQVESKVKVDKSLQEYLGLEWF